MLRDRNVKVLANAGGINPVACAREVRRLAPDLKIAIVLGDDVLDRIDEFLAQGHEMRNMDTGEPLTHDPRANHAAPTPTSGLSRWRRRWRPAPTS